MSGADGGKSAEDFKHSVDGGGLVQSGGVMCGIGGALQRDDLHASR